MAAKSLIQPGFGNAVEVFVAWQERIIGTHRFIGDQVVTWGPDPTADVVVPLDSFEKKTPFLKLLNGVSFVNGIPLRQGEVVQLKMQEDKVSVYVRYGGHSPRPMAGPIADFNAVDGTGIILVAVISAIFSLYMNIYEPEDLDLPPRKEEPRRRAVAIFRQPKPLTPIEVAIEPSPRLAEVRSTPAQPKPNYSRQKQQKPSPAQGLFNSPALQKALERSTKSFSIRELVVGSRGEGGQVGEVGVPKIRDLGGSGGSGGQSVHIGGVNTRGRDTGFGGPDIGIGERAAAEIMDISGQEAEVTGSVDRDAIRRVIQNNRNSIRHCYDLALQRKPDLFGKVVLDWTITEEGRVRQASVRSNTLGDAKVGQCLVQKIKGLQFPQLPAGFEGQIRFPFVFSSQ